MVETQMHLYSGKSFYSIPTHENFEVKKVFRISIGEKKMLDDSFFRNYYAYFDIRVFFLLKRKTKKKLLNRIIEWNYTLDSRVHTQYSNRPISTLFASSIIVKVYLSLT